MFSAMESHEPVLDRLYAAFASGIDMEASLDAMRGLLDASSCWVGTQSLTHQSVLSTTEPDDEMAKRYFDHYSKLDPMHKLMHSTSTSNVLLRSDFMDLRSHEQTDFYNDVHQPIDMYNEMVLTRRSSDRVLWFSVGVAKRQAEKPEVAAKINYLRPHIQRCLRIWELTNNITPQNQSFVQTYDMTPKEDVIVNHLLKGYSYSDICERLSISSNTLKWHMKNIFQKCCVDSLPGLLLKLLSQSKGVPTR